MIRGDYQINEDKLKKEINKILEKNILKISLIKDEEIEEIFNCPAGYISPINLKSDTPIIADISIQGLTNGVAGANIENYHYKNVCCERDFLNVPFVNIHLAKETDICSRCSIGEMQISRGIEIGHIFKLGDKYTKALDVAVLDKDGKKKNLTMGCYGIGVSRLLAAIVECYHDEEGIIFPKEIAPFDVHLITLDEDEQLISKAQEIYDALRKNKIEVLWDDRKERAGFKFKEADLIGIPHQIILGKKGFAKGEGTIKNRKSKEKKEMGYREILDYFFE